MRQKERGDITLITMSIIAAVIIKKKGNTRYQEQQKQDNYGGKG
jgi:hypothetical protein